MASDMFKQMQGFNPQNFMSRLNELKAKGEFEKFIRKMEQM